jgi:hypothetical protein
MKRIIVVAAVALYWLYLPAQARAQFRYGHYQTNKWSETLALTVAAVTFRNGYKFTFVVPMQICPGNLTFQWDFFVDKFYMGQYVNSADNIQTGKDTCTSGGSSFDILPGPPIVATNSFVQNTNSQIIVNGTGNGAFIASVYTYTHTSTSLSSRERQYSAPPFDLAWNTIFTYVVKRPGEAVHTIVGPLRDIYQLMNR